MTGRGRVIVGCLCWLFFVALIFLGTLYGKSGHGHGKPSPTPSPTPNPTPTATPIPIPTPIPQVALVWNASSGATGYHLRMGFISGAENKSIDVGNALVWTLQLTSDTTYFFVVTAYNSAGDSPSSNEVFYTTPP